MRKSRTTICCSRAAIAVVGAALLNAQGPPKSPSPLPFKTAWTVPLNGSLAAPPAFSGQRGFFPIDDGRLVAYDLTLGAELWATVQSIAVQPATGDGLVFVIEPGSVAALGEADGSVRWRLPFSESLATPLVFDNGWLIAAVDSGAILAFRASDGHLIWRRDIGSKANARPALAADRVYIPTANQRIIALQVEDGTPLWERRLGGPPNEVLALDDRLYAGSDDNYLYCLMAADGRIDWRWPTGGDVVGLPIVDQRQLYFVSKDNVLRALDRRSGAQRWRRALPLRPQSGPLRTDDALIVSGIAPLLRAYFLRDGAPAGDVATDGELASAPYVLPGVDAPTVLVVTRNVEKGAMLTSLTREGEPAPAAPASTPVAPPKP